MCRAGAAEARAAVAAAAAALPAWASLTPGQRADVLLRSAAAACHRFMDSEPASMRLAVDALYPDGSLESPQDA